MKMGYLLFECFCQNWMLPSSVDRAIDGVLLYSHHALKRIVGEIELRLLRQGRRREPH